MKKKAFGIASLVLTLISFVMMFFPQIALSLTCYGNKISGQCNWAGCLYGGELNIADYRVGVFKGSVIGALGYIFIGVALLLLLLAALVKDNAVKIMIKLLALIFVLVGTFFVWFVGVHFAYVNDLSVGITRSGYTYNAIGLGYGAIIGGIASSLAPITIIGSIAARD